MKSSDTNEQYRKTLSLGPDVCDILDRVVNTEKQYDSYSAAVRRAVRSTF
ncbi:hypothetical protein ACSAZK_06845 [Methanosarcina sp. Mfa9]